MKSEALHCVDRLSLSRRSRSDNPPSGGSKGWRPLWELCPHPTAAPAIKLVAR